MTTGHSSFWLVQIPTNLLACLLHGHNNMHSTFYAARGVNKRFNYQLDARAVTLLFRFPAERARVRGTCRKSHSGVEESFTSAPMKMQPPKPSFKFTHKQTSPARSSSAHHGEIIIPMVRLDLFDEWPKLDVELGPADGDHKSKTLMEALSPTQTSCTSVESVCYLSRGPPKS